MLNRWGKGLAAEDTLRGRIPGVLQAKGRSDNYSVLWWRQKHPKQRCRDSQTTGTGDKAMSEQLYTYDPAEALDSPEAIKVFLDDAFETGDAAYIAKALGVVAKAKGMGDIASKTGLSREQLYRSFSDKGNPTLKTILAVMQALGLTMAAKQTMNG